jgi:hypothetical protein
VVHESLDLGLGHHRTDPRRMRVHDGSRHRRHFVARVRSRSNGAESVNAHAQRSAVWSGGASAWPAGVRVWTGARARKQADRKIVGRLRLWKCVTPVFPKKTKCKPICMPGSSFTHIVDISE